MFVSILQLMGLAWGKPIQSRADSAPAPAEPPAIADAEPIDKRRPAVKSATAKARAESKASPKVDAPVKKAKAKAAAPAAAEPAKKASVSPAKAKVGAPAALPKAASAAPKPAPAPAPRKTQTTTVAKKATPAPEQARAAVPAKPAPAVSAPAAPVATPPRTRVTRGARLAQMTVPSMAQAVASTAAKASYDHTMPIATLPSAPNSAALKKDPKRANNWKIKPVEELTDDDILAMPDEEYMNPTQLAFFRLKLQRLKADILNNAGETTEHLREDTVVVPDPADRATIEEEHALELRTRDRERKLLKKIDQSIARIDSGDYGYCDETGEPIGVGRLLARPTATLSLEAQQRRELRQKMFGD